MRTAPGPWSIGVNRSHRATERSSGSQLVPSSPRSQLVPSPCPSKGRASSPLCHYVSPGLLALVIPWYIHYEHLRSTDHMTSFTAQRHRLGLSLRSLLSFLTGDPLLCFCDGLGHPQKDVTDASSMWWALLSSCCFLLWFHRVPISFPILSALAWMLVKTLYLEGSTQPFSQHLQLWGVV